MLSLQVRDRSTHLWIVPDSQQLRYSTSFHMLGDGNVHAEIGQGAPGVSDRAEHQKENRQSSPGRKVMDQFQHPIQRPCKMGWMVPQRPGNAEDPTKHDQHKAEKNA